MCWKKVPMCKAILLNFLCVVCLMFSYIFPASAQKLDTVTVYNHAKSTPLWSNSQVEQLADYLAKPFKDDASKVLAFAYWICTNMHCSFVYDQTYTPQTRNILQTKSTNPEGFAILMQALCEHAHIPSEIVYGYVRDFDFTDTLRRANHVWNVVRINNTWRLFDLTFAAGSFTFVPEKTVSFTTTTSPKFSYSFVPQYNPKWLSVNPNTMIQTHFPLLRCMQMREKPVPFSVFIHGNDAVQKFMSAYPESAQNNAKLTAFHELTSQKKYQQIAQESEYENPLNVRDKAYWLYTAVHEIKTEAYLEYVNRIFARFHILRPMKEQVVLADSLISIALQQNSEEFASKRKKSESWRLQTLSYNKELIEKYQTYIKTYTTQEKAFSRLEKQQNSFLSFLTLSANKFSEQEILEVPRPFVHLNDDMYERVFLLLHADSIASLKRELLQEYQQSTQNIASLDYLQTIVNAEQNLLAMFQQNQQKCIVFLENKYTNLTDNFYDENTFVTNICNPNITIVNSILKPYSNTLILSVNEAQSKRFDLIREYIRLSSEQFRFVKEAKKKSYVNVGEDSVYAAIVNEYIQQCNEFSTDIKLYTQVVSQLKSLFQQQNQELTETVKVIKLEDSYATARHTEYSAHITRIRNTEQNVLMYMRAELKTIKKLIDSELN
ncbi:MAG TPA: transglutaminase-like domain-containing protein [Bacteroidales bacterium]|nr:transglutaminase-like domain-containing protein [Bacteroidales bacterium]